MYRTRKLTFKHGRYENSAYVTMKDQSKFTRYMMLLCEESNKVTPTKFISVKSKYDEWTIKIKTSNKNYFNLIAQKFIDNFGDVISDIKF